MVVVVVIVVVVGVVIDKVLVVVVVEGEDGLGFVNPGKLAKTRGGVDASGSRALRSFFDLARGEDLSFLFEVISCAHGTEIGVCRAKLEWCGGVIVGTPMLREAAWSGSRARPAEYVNTTLVDNQVSLDSSKNWEVGLKSCMFL